MLRKQPTTTTRLQHTFERTHRSTDAAPPLPTYKDAVATCVNVSVIELLGKEQNIERVKPTRPSMNALPSLCSPSGAHHFGSPGGRMARWSLIMGREGTKEKKAEKDEETGRQRARQRESERELERVRES